MTTQAHIITCVVCGLCVPVVSLNFFFSFFSEKNILKNCIRCLKSAKNAFSFCLVPFSLLTQMHCCA